MTQYTEGGDTTHTGGGGGGDTTHRGGGGGGVTQHTEGGGVTQYTERGWHSTEGGRGDTFVQHTSFYLHCTHKPACHPVLEGGYTALRYAE